MAQAGRACAQRELREFTAFSASRGQARSCPGRRHYLTPARWPGAGWPGPCREHRGRHAGAHEASVEIPFPHGVPEHLCAYVHTCMNIHVCMHTAHKHTRAHMITRTGTHTGTRAQHKHACTHDHMCRRCPGRRSASSLAPAPVRPAPVSSWAPAPVQDTVREQLGPGHHPGRPP